ncbi:MAG: GNAT family N-acetyltransferase, partial [Actinomycetes bacterium]
GMILRPLEMRDEAEALAGDRELALEDWGYLLGYEPGMAWGTYLEALENDRIGRNLAEGRVTATFLIAEAEGHLIGRSSIRHELNDFLFNVGGHIGYGVRPEFRRRGYATEILKQSLEMIRKLGVNEVLITCDDENIGSAKVIESQGGILENRVEFEGTLKRRYWIHQR